jgi:MSHA biogenesis protein MshP
MNAGRETQGFALVGAIFIVVVMAIAGAYMLSVSGVQRESTNLALLGPRAYYAAQSGLEWALHEAVATPATCPADTFSLTEGALVGFDVTVTCTKTRHTENAVTTTVFRITSKAEYGTYGGRDYVSRQLETTAMVSQ